MRKRNLIVGLVAVVCVCMTGGRVSGYFEYKYLCSVEDNSITVSIKTGEKLCFEYIADVDNNLRQVDSQIFQADVYIDNDRNASYRLSVKTRLVAQKSQLQDLQQQFVATIDDYEIDLFHRVKGILTFYLKDERDRLHDQIAQLRKLLLELKLQGATLEYEKTVKHMENLLQFSLLLERIKSSNSFDELIVPLKSYMRLVEEVPSVIE